MKHTEIMELGAVALGALALLVVLRRGGSPDATPSQGASSGTEATPTYLTQNQPTSYAQNSVGFAPASDRNGGTLPSCACGQAPVDYSSLQSFTDSLTAANENIVNEYQASITSAMPSWMGQFINNTFAPDQTAAAEGRFSQLASGA